MTEHSSITTKRPLLRLTHPNLYSMIVVLICMHFALALSSFLGPHTTPLWFYFGGRFPIVSLGVSHLLIAMTLIHGLRRRRSWIEVGLLASVTIFLLKLCLFTAAVIRSYVTPGVLDLSIEVPIITGGLLLLAVFAYRQPWGRLAD